MRPSQKYCLALLLAWLVSAQVCQARVSLTSWLPAQDVAPDAGSDVGSSWAISNAGRSVYQKGHKLARHYLFPSPKDTLSNLTQRGLGLTASSATVTSLSSTRRETWASIATTAQYVPSQRRGGSALRPVVDPNRDGGEDMWRVFARDGSINWGFLLFGTPTSPWTFATGRYMVTLIVVTVLVNRIQTICRPRGRALSVKGAQRLLVKLPSLFMLSHALVMTTYLTVALIYLHPSGLPSFRAVEGMNKLTWSYFFNTSPWKYSVIPLGQQDRTREVFWTTFLAVVSAQATEVFLATLESRRDEVPTINLFTFAIVLSEGSATLPTAIVVWLTVAELLCLAVAGSWKRSSHSTLPITSFFSIIGMIHYLTSFRSGYPFAHGLNRLPDLCLMMVILATAFLQGLTMLLSEGSIDVRRLLPGRPGRPSLSDEFSIAIFKWGTACLENSAISNGFARELAAVKMLSQTKAELEILKVGTHVELSEEGRTRFVEVRSRNSPNVKTNGLDLEVKQVRVSAPPLELSSGIITGRRRMQAISQFLQAALVHVTLLTGLGWNYVQHRIPGLRLPRWIYPVARKIRLFWHGTNGEARREQRLAARLAADATRRQEMQQFVSQLTVVRRTDNLSDAGNDEIDWQRVLAPDAPLQEDDDSTDFLPDDASSVSARSDESTSSGLFGLPQASELLPQDPDESLALLDLARMGQADQGDDFHQVMLAHLAATGRPITRTSFRSRLHGDNPTQQGQGSASRIPVQSEDIALLSIARERRRQREPNDTSSAHPCAICCYEERTIILWPCRCLNMCDGCRQSISSQTHKGKHRCPTCRSEVKGYSRIWRP